jgi:hypothetical protein
MLVYGDHAERIDPRSRLAALALERDRLLAIPPGLARHVALVGLFIGMAGLTQGVADASFAKHGFDRQGDAEVACMAVLASLAAAVRMSWDSRFDTAGEIPEPAVVAALPPTVDIRLAEGFAFYALYPEAYIEAARRLQCPGPVQVIGIRSIGTGLAAIVAATLGAPAPITLRPTGHPFDRRMMVAPALARRLLADGRATYVIVDEGPGLSGSSFGAVADWLQDRGVPLARIAFLSSYGGDLAPRASERHRARWARAQRAAADTDVLLAKHLPGWAADLLGPLDSPLESISDGRWRERVWRDKARWPAVNPMWERRKFLARVGDATWLLKFAGLGATGEAKLARAQALFAAGYGPEPRGLVHGFLIERWMEGAPLVETSHGQRGELLRSLGSYLGFRDRMLPAGEADGASLAELLDMARFNTAQAMGEAHAAKLDAWRPMLPRLECRIRRVETDNRCLAHEWLELPDGRLLKADALDHHAAHDLVGCQDIAWDIAGSAIELGLPVGELAAMVSQAAGRPIDPELIALLAPCYLAFRIGCHRLTAETLRDWPEEEARNRAAADRYAAMLARLLDGANEKGPRFE